MCEHKWIVWSGDGSYRWYRKCTECGAMEATSIEEGFAHMDEYNKLDWPSWEEVGVSK